MIEILTAAETAERLRAEGFRTSPETVREGILQRQYPWGTVITDENGKIKRCDVYAVLLDKWLDERRGETAR